MTARISLVPGRARGHRPRLQRARRRISGVYVGDDDDKNHAETAPRHGHGIDQKPDDPSYAEILVRQTFIRLHREGGGRMFVLAREPGQWRYW